MIFCLVGFLNPDDFLTTPGQCYEPIIADLNKDGNPDIVANSNSYPTGAIYVWLGNGQANPTFTYLTNLGLSACYSPRVADFNNDGNPDIMSAFYDGIFVWYGDGQPTPTFTQGTSVASGGWSLFLTIGDLDGDGDTDVVSGRQDVRVYENLGGPNPNWSLRNTLDDGPDYHAAVLGDLDGDSDLDIIAGCQNALQGVDVWRNNGGFSWTLMTPPVSSGEFIDLWLGDVDGDGDPDLAGANNGAGAYVYELTGPFSWIQRNNMLAGRQCWGVAFADFNGDGNLDLVANDVTQRYVNLWLGNGAFGWASEGTLLPQAYYENLWPGDLNKDGKIDLTGGAWSPTGVQTWLNDYPMSTDDGENEAFPVAVWPNPASSQVNFSLETQAPFSLKLYDATGRPVLEKHAFGSCDLDISGLSPGIYLYRVNQGEKAITGRLSIAR